MFSPSRAPGVEGFDCERSVDDREDVERGAALAQVVEDVVRRQRAVLEAAHRERDDDGARGLATLELLGGF
jgi:hypothetical protein